MHKCTNIIIENATEQVLAINTLVLTAVIKGFAVAHDANQLANNGEKTMSHINGS